MTSHRQDEGLLVLQGNDFPGIGYGVLRYLGACSAVRLSAWIYQKLKPK